jgi:hypothetical protein
MFNIPSEIITAIIAATASVTGPIIAHFIKQTTAKNKDLIKESLETSLQVDMKLENIREEFDADRVWIAQFHNGGYFYPTGKSIQKFSVCYETLRLGIEPTQQNFQNIPISLFSKPINYLLENNIIEVPDYDSTTLAKELDLKSITTITKSKSSYMFSIRSFEGRFIGILGVSYIEKERILTHEEITQIALEVSTVGGVLMTLLSK